MADSPFTTSYSPSSNMLLDELDITELKGIGDKRTQLFMKLGVPTVGALLRFYPRGYEDWSDVKTVRSVVPGEVSVIRGTLTTPVTTHFVRKGMTLYTAAACDDGGVRFKVTFFNNPYIPRILRQDSTYLFRGRVTFDYGTAQMNSPLTQPDGAVDNFVPKYRCVEGLNSKTIAQSVGRALALMNDSSFPDPLPDGYRRKRRLCSQNEAIRQIHAPENEEKLSQARERLVYDELLTLQLALFTMKGRSVSETAKPFENDFTDGFFSLLPFEPTGAQKRAVAEAVADMKKKTPMSRLLQGDVGSGKTAVAAALCYHTAKNGCQSALMAPTEILAEQHYNTLSKMLEGTGVTVCLLTGSMKAKEKRETREKIKSGECKLAVGTHALISEGVEFDDLALVITDEQHRFGVKQRSALAQKGQSPHMLVMSATPIPRTLALIMYGDLDVSVLDELPKGRQKIETYVIGGDKRERAYNYVRKFLDEGRQGYIVCPLVEESEEMTELAPAKQYAKQLAENEFKGYTVGLLHGKMSGAEKEKTMRGFANGEIQLLVSTTVVEVGVDVPNAVIMVIENAERFGLSQLHQLRGRVGRGSYQSTCILISDAENETAKSRLNTMRRTSDGFEIAAEDLKLRGPGEFFGSRQSGLSTETKIADLALDMRVFTQAQDDAREILKKDGALEKPEHKELKRRVSQLFDESFIG